MKLAIAALGLLMSCSSLATVWVENRSNTDISYSIKYKSGVNDQSYTGTIYKKANIAGADENLTIGFNTTYDANNHQCTLIQLGSIKEIAVYNGAAGNGADLSGVNSDCQIIINSTGTSVTLSDQCITANCTGK